MRIMFNARICSFIFHLLWMENSYSTRSNWIGLCWGLKKMKLWQDRDKIFTWFNQLTLRRATIKYIFRANLRVCGNVKERCTNKKESQNFSLPLIQFHIAYNSLQLLFLNQCPKTNIYIWNRYVHQGYIQTFFAQKRADAKEQSLHKSCPVTYILQANEISSPFHFHDASVAYHRGFICQNSCCICMAQ